MRTILIVDDDPVCSEQYKMICSLALINLAKAGLELPNPGEIIQLASNYAEAMDCLKNRRVDFLSLDLALEKNEVGLKDKDRRLGRDPGGMQVLKELSTLAHPPITVVVSGETLLSYAKDALQKYGVLAFYPKDEENFFMEYQAALQTALWYREAEDWLNRVESGTAGMDGIARVQRCWQQARYAADRAGAGERSLSQDLTIRIAGLSDKIDHATSLPGESLTEQAMRHMLIRQKGWLLIQVEIDNYSAFTHQQASQVGPALRNAAELLRAASAELGGSEVFIGTWRRERASGPSILAVIKPSPGLNIPELLERVRSDFRQIAHNFTDSFRPPEESVLPVLALRCWSEAEHPFGDLPDLINKLAEKIN